ncbi:MAG TPA: hypothetical protein VEI50_07430 [Nitrospiraceae bacterium]|nr:hypothetical protein [Nitrospiraceae bacterium]
MACRFTRISNITVLAGILTVITLGLTGPLAAATAKQQKPAVTKSTPASDTARRYAEAIAKGDRVTVGQLDFACQYRIVAASPAAVKSYPPENDPSYDSCWQTLKTAHAPVLKRDDVAMTVLWPSAGLLAFFGDELPRMPASAFVMEELGISPPGTGLHVTVAKSQSIPSGSFRLKPNGKVVEVPTTLVFLTVSYQDLLTSPVTYAAGVVKRANTIKRARAALKSVTTQWVIFTGLKKHGFPGDAAVFNLPVSARPETPGVVPEQIPFTTEKSRALPDSLLWWGPTDQPGTLTAAAARAATFPDLRDRVALLNRILIIDPNQPDALTVLTRHLYAVFLREGKNSHQVMVKDPALSLVVDEFYWNVYAQSIRMDLSNDMEMGGLPQPTPADYLFRMLPALETLAKVRPEQLDNRFRLGAAYRWNNEQQAAIDTDEALVKDIPEGRKAAKAEAMLQLAWSRMHKVAWNRILDDPEINRAYGDAEASLAMAELPIDKFLAEYTMAYCMIFMPNYGDKAKLLHHLTEAKRWFDEVPGKTDEVWRYFLHSELLKAVLDADPSFKPILASAEEHKS